MKTLKDLQTELCDCFVQTKKDPKKTPLTNVLCNTAGKIIATVTLKIKQHEQAKEIFVDEFIGKTSGIKMTGKK